MKLDPTQMLGATFILVQTEWSATPASETSQPRRLPFNPSSSSAAFVFPGPDVATIRMVTRAFAVRLGAPGSDASQADHVPTEFIRPADPAAVAGMHHDARTTHAALR